MKLLAETQISCPSCYELIKVPVILRSVSAEPQLGDGRRQFVKVTFEEPVLLHVCEEETDGP